MRIQRILGLAVVVAASSLGVACTGDNDRAQSTFHPTWERTSQGAYGGGPQSASTVEGTSIGITNGTAPTDQALGNDGTGTKTEKNTPKTDDNHGFGGLGSGTTGTGTNIDADGPAGVHGPQPPAIKSTGPSTSNGNSGAH